MKRMDKLYEHVEAMPHIARNNEAGEPAVPEKISSYEMRKEEGMKKKQVHDQCQTGFATRVVPGFPFTIALNAFRTMVMVL